VVAVYVLQIYFPLILCDISRVATDPETPTPKESLRILFAICSQAAET